jgi:hypothetical protein
MATRIPVSWIILLVILAVFGFFGYHILQASNHTETLTPDHVAQSQQQLAMAGNSVAGAAGPMHMHRSADQNSIKDLLKNPPAEAGFYEDGESSAPVVQKQAPIPNSMPHVPGQTEEDLRAPEPLQATPPAVQYDAPEATDPMNRHVFMSSEFGSNLRHPEQMMEHRPPSNMSGVVNSGLGSERTNPGGNRVTAFAPEMAQNGGEFMQGISAFDTTDIGTGFSML